MTKKKIVFLTLSVAFLLSLLGGALFGQPAPKNDLYRYLSIFSEVFDLVRSNYVEQVTPDQLMEGAFGGVTDAVDEFSYYVPPQHMPAYKNFVDVEDNGVGLVVTKRFGYAYVIAAVAGSPAAKAGIERGDFVEKINGMSAQKMAIWQIRNALRGPQAVKLLILRGGQTKRDEFTIQAAAFHPVALKSEQIGSVSYIKIPYFEAGTASQFQTALEAVRKRGTKKLIVDLRGNAGGDVVEAIRAADALLDRGTITTLTGRKIEAKSWAADAATAWEGELQVLADNSTAAGAEIFAAAMRGNNRGKLVGVTTYGKSIVQRFVLLPSGGGVQMTVGHYTTPDAKPIKETGVRPDVSVDLSSQSIREEGEKAKERDDLILQKALSLFGEQPAVLKKAA